MIDKKIWLMVVLPVGLLLLSLLLWWHNTTPVMPVRALPLVENCQLHQHACSIQDHEIRVTIDTNVKPIPIAKGIDFTVTIEGMVPTHVQLDINGSNMYMGYNRIYLTPQADGSWKGKSLLAFCTIDAMQWQLTVLIDTAEGQQLQVPFPLVTPYTHTSS